MDAYEAKSWEHLTVVFVARVLPKFEFRDRVAGLCVLIGAGVQ